LPLLRLGYTVSADSQNPLKDLILSVGLEKTPTEANYFLIQSEHLSLMKSATGPQNPNNALPLDEVEGLLGGMRILLLDDSEDTVEMLCRLLQMDGATVTTAHSGSEALDLARMFEFDVVLTDISMPEMSGFEFLQAFRSLPAQTEVPVVALTGFVVGEEADRAAREGFSHHVTKPIEIETLIQLVVSLRQKQSSAASQF